MITVEIEFVGFYVILVTDYSVLLMIALLRSKLLSNTYWSIQSEARSSHYHRGNGRGGEELFD
jgi:hypothetical protein